MSGLLHASDCQSEKRSSSSLGHFQQVYHRLILQKGPFVMFEVLFGYRIQISVHSVIFLISMSHSRFN